MARPRGAKGREKTRQSGLPMPTVRDLGVGLPGVEHGQTKALSAQRDTLSLLADQLGVPVNRQWSHCRNCARAAICGLRSLIEGVTINA